VNVVSQQYNCVMDSDGKVSTFASDVYVKH